MWLINLNQLPKHLQQLPWCRVPCFCCCLLNTTTNTFTSAPYQSEIAVPLQERKSRPEKGFSTTVWRISLLGNSRHHSGTFIMSFVYFLYLATGDLKKKSASFRILHLEIPALYSFYIQWWAVSVECWATATHRIPGWRAIEHSGATVIRIHTQSIQ